MTSKEVAGSVPQVIVTVCPIMTSVVTPASLTAYMLVMVAEHESPSSASSPSVPSLPSRIVKVSVVVPQVMATEIPVFGGFGRGPVDV